MRHRIKGAIAELGRNPSLLDMVDAGFVGTGSGPVD
jgi:hypothetical protein